MESLNTFSHVNVKQQQRNLCYPLRSKLCTFKRRGGL